MLAFIEKLTLTPDAVDVNDAKALRAANISHEAAQDAIYVAMLFAIYNRYADAFGFTLPNDGYQMAPKVLLSFIGYR